MLNAVLSLSTVFEFKTVEAREVRPAVDRAFQLLEQRLSLSIDASEEVRDYLAASCGGDTAASTTRKPACASSSATASPIPRLAPVTIAVLSKLSASFILS